MKKKHFNKKLQLNKTTISNIQVRDMANLRGGGLISRDPCPSFELPCASDFPCTTVEVPCDSKTYCTGCYC